MQAVVLLLAVSLSGVCGNEERSDPDTLSIIRAIEALQTQMKTLQDQVQTMAQVQSQVQTMETSLVQIQSLVQQQNSSRVAFHAGFYTRGKDGRYGPFNTPTTIKFQNVRTNVGNGYNSETGLFTAPFRGVYVFHLTVSSLLSSSFTYSNVLLKKNSETLMETVDTVSAQDQRDSSSNTAVVILEPGDTVRAELYTNNVFYDDNGRSTTFRGFLLFPL